MLPLLFAFLAPLGFATSILIDKHILSYKVKRTTSYIPLAACASLLISCIIAPFLSWHLTAYDLLFPMLSGMFMASMIVCYFLILEEQDPSNVAGFNGLYPILIALLAFLFLHEQVPWYGYGGMLLIIMGVFLLSKRTKRITTRTKFLIAGSVLSLTLLGFFAKLAVSRVPELNALVIASTTESIFLLLILTKKEVREGFLHEVKNVGWAFLSELANMGGAAANFFALAAAPVTIVASIGAIIPFLLLLGERLIDLSGRRKLHEHLLLPKLAPILLITSGIVLLAFAGFS